jgi:hypothetical protein
MGHEIIFISLGGPWNTYNLFALNNQFSCSIKLWESDSVNGLIKVTAILYIFTYSRMGREIFPMTYDGLWNLFRFSGWVTGFFWKTYFSLQPTLAVTLWPVPNVIQTIAETALLKMGGLNEKRYVFLYFERDVYQIQWTFPLITKILI